MAKTYIALACALAMYSCAAKPQNSSPFIVQHRGAKELADENTLKAYSLAADMGRHCIEADLTFTNDYQFVMMHDYRLNRTTDGKGLVKHHTFEEVRSLRTDGGEQVPTLEQTLSLANERGLGINLDIKFRNTYMLGKAMEMVRTYGMQDKVILGLSSIKLQKYMEKSNPDIQTALSWPYPLTTLNRSKDLGAEWISTFVTFATPQFISRCHELGMKVMTMPINKERRIEKKVKAGIDCVQTDLIETDIKQSGNPEDFFHKDL